MRPATGTDVPTIPGPNDSPARDVNVPDHVEILRRMADRVENVDIGAICDIDLLVVGAVMRSAADEIDRLRDEVRFGIEKYMAAQRTLTEQAAVHDARRVQLSRLDRTFARQLEHIKALSAEVKRLRRLRFESTDDTEASAS